MLIATGSLLVLAVAFWRWGGSAPAHERADGDTTSAGISSVVAPQMLDGRDPAAERAWNAELPAVESACVTNSFLLDWASALQSLSPESDVLEWERKLERLVHGIASADVPAAVSFLNERAYSENNRDLKFRLVRRWATNNPRAAADWVSEKSIGSRRPDEIKSVATVWGNQNLPDAVGWVQQLAEDEERRGGLIALAYEAARIEPITALSLAEELPANEVRADLIAHTASQWAASAAEAAAAWAKQIADGALRERVLANIAAAWAERDPVAAATLAVQSLSTGKPQGDAVVGIVQRWVQTEPEQAAAWVTTFPEGTLGQSVLENLVKLWADQNWEQAGKWLAGLDLGERRDKAIGTYVCQIMPRFPGTAARWAENIGNDLLRHQQMETVGEAWMESDASAARVWITQAALHETTKARLLALRPE